jgi:hypothetical protein
VLALAAREGRILISHDLESMHGHFWDFSAHQESPGVFLIAQDVPVAIALEAIIEIWSASEIEEWRNRLVYLPL